jgi:hypothetical protein
MQPRKEQADARGPSFKFGTARYLSSRWRITYYVITVLESCGLKFERVDVLLYIFMHILRTVHYSAGISLCRNLSTTCKIQIS